MPEGEWLAEPLRSGEGAVIADLDFTLIDRTPTAYVHERGPHAVPMVAAESDEATI